MTERPIALPDKLSDLAQLAIDDAESLDRSRYWPNAYAFHSPKRIAERHADIGIVRRCNVCLAGFVIAGTLRADPTAFRTPDEYDLETHRKLGALDFVRTGELTAAFDLLHEPRERNDQYHRDRKRIRRVIRALRDRREPATDWEPMFIGWKQFDRHARYIRMAVDELRAEGL